MATDLTLEEHVGGLREAVDRMTSDAAEAGLSTPVPTCPGWTVRDLVAHLGMVHRWATANLVGDTEVARTPEPSEVEGRNEPNPLTWLRSGVDALLEAIDAAADDVEALVFLKDPPPPRQFWARRQCHETTIHAVDALAAKLGRTPTARETSIPTTIAVDGVDELLTGFVPRRRERLHSTLAYTIGVMPADVPTGWILEVGEGPVVTTRYPGPEMPSADREVSGSAVELYLALWNRGDEVTDESDLLSTWRDQMTVTW